ncbi:MAG: hypothetical protein V4520_12345 [Bacteroidota bacterium]
MNTATARNTLCTLLILLGIGALFGGSVLIISPSGRLLGMPLTLLKHSPFTDFLIPGIVLFILLGLAPCLLVYALLKRQKSPFAEKLNLFTGLHWAWSFTIYLASLLIAWILAEMYFIQAVHWSHMLYIFWGLAIIYVALLPQVRNLYRV